VSNVRIEFSDKTKKIVAGRSGYICSYPECQALTIGPARENDGISNTGEAAHIYSAAKKGPRGQASLTEAQLKSVANAIWLCGTHATMVDNNRGTAYPPAVLVSYKGLHEASIARRHRGIHAPLGWFQELLIIEGPLFNTPAKIQFGQLTFLAGGNATGKSALWEWLAGISDPTWALRRWRRTGRADVPPLRFEVTYFNPAKNTVGVQILESGKISFHLNNQEVPFNPISTRFIVVSEAKGNRLAEHEREAWNTWSDLQRISSALHIDVTAIENILPQVGGDARSVQRIWIEESRERDADPDDDHTRRSELMVKLKWHGFYLPFFQLSSSEQAHVLVELGIALASFSAHYVPTVLVLENFWVFDETGKAEWIQYFSPASSSGNHLFQTIIEIGTHNGELDRALEPSWEWVSLVGSGPVVEIRQFGAG
jgi:hypothetical protein